MAHCRNHYNFKSIGGDGDDDGSSNSISLACLETHGNEETGQKCYVCDLLAVLETYMADADTRKLFSRKARNHLHANSRYYAAAFEGVDIDGEWKFDGPAKVFGFPTSVKNEIMKIVKAQKQFKEVPFHDEKKGLCLYVSKEGSGLQTKWSVERGGQPQDINELIPGWESKIFTDIWAQLDLKVYDRDLQKRVFKYSYPKLDWERIEQEFSL
jgi:hypothetical protein